MPDEDKPEGLRIGGWVPPYRDTKGPLRPPVPPRRRGPAAFSAALLTGPIRRHVDGGLGRRAVAAVATGTLIAVAGITALALRGGDDDSALAQRVVLPPYAPSAPISILPPPSAGSSAGPGSVTRVPARSRETEATTTTRRPTARPTATRPTTTAPAAARLVVDETVGLVLADHPGYRLRHRGFVARLDDIGSGSSREARRDSRFTVRRGLAASGCASLEADNYPGYFLRHRNFELRLDKWDSSQLYQRDATFCSHTVRNGRALILEALNYPGYFVVARSSGVRIERVAAAQATAFLVREPL